MELERLSSPTINIQDWGVVDYETAVNRQLELVDALAGGDQSADGQSTRAMGDTLVFCSHPPVVTLGRATTSEDLIGWDGDTIETARGGRATYHGPSQLVIYPIIDLRVRRADLPEKDIHAYLRVLEQTTVKALQSLGLVEAEARTTQAGEISLTGVWVGDKKIASIGIAVRKWISYHGIAINVEDDPQAFRGIRPCGFSSDVMTSVEAQLRSVASPASSLSADQRSTFLAELRQELKNAFFERFQPAILPI